MIPQGGGEINILILLRAIKWCSGERWKRFAQLQILGKSVLRRGKNEMALNALTKQEIISQVLLCKKYLTAKDKDFKYCTAK